MYTNTQTKCRGCGSNEVYRASHCKACYSTIYFALNGNARRMVIDTFGTDPSPVYIIPESIITQLQIENRN